MRKIRILNLISTFEVGGAEMQLLRFLRQADRTRFEYIVCATVRTGPLESEFMKLGLRIYILNKKKGVIAYLLNVYEIYKIIKMHKIDILHPSGFETGVRSRIAALTAGVKYIIYRERGLNVYKRGYLLYIERILGLFTDKIITQCDFSRRLRLQRERYAPNKLVKIYNGIDVKDLLTKETEYIFEPQSINGCVQKQKIINIENV